MNDLRDAATRLAGEPPSLARVELRAGRLRRTHVRLRVAATALVVVVGLAGAASVASRSGEADGVAAVAPPYHPYPGEPNVPGAAAGWDLAQFAANPSDEVFDELGLAPKVQLLVDDQVVATRTKAELRDLAAWSAGGDSALLAMRGWFDDMRFARQPSPQCGGVPTSPQAVVFDTQVVMEDGDPVPCAAWAAIHVYLLGGQVVGVGVQRAPEHLVGQEETEQALAVTTFLRDPNEATAAAAGFAPQVALLLGSRPMASRTPTELLDPTAWEIGDDSHPALVGPFSALQVLASHTDGLTMGVGPGGGCPREDPRPPDLDFHQRIYFEPEHIDSCLQWFRVVVYLRGGLVVGVGLDLYEP